MLLDNLPAAGNHDGGTGQVRARRYAYATLGDAGDAATRAGSELARRKIVRLNRDGTVPSANPFPGSPVYSFGHRNPKGLAWQPGTRTALRDRARPTGNDEVNLIEPGQNYGWPTAQGPNHPSPFRAPLVTYSPSVAPAGATFYRGAASAVDRQPLLHHAPRDPPAPAHASTRTGTKVVGDERLYQGEYGRLRDVVEGLDGALYVDHQQPRRPGQPGPGDDRILRIGPRAVAVRRSRSHPGHLAAARVPGAQGLGAARRRSRAGW